jgi:hypothetical protein
MCIHTWSSSYSCFVSLFVELKTLETTLMENVSESLTKNLWQLWKTNHIETKMTWLEVQKLAQQFIKMCQEAQVDHQAIDFINTIDSKLNYHENLSSLDNEVYRFANPQSALDAMGEDYKTAEELKEKIGTAETKNANLKRKITIQKENQIFDNQEIKDEIKKVQDQQSRIITALSNLPNLEQQIKALQESSSFKDLGKTLSPIIETIPEKPVKPKRHYSLPKWLKPNQEVKLLDAFAGALVFVLWVAATGWMLSSFGFSWGFVAGLAVFWLVFIVAFRVIIGGILD